MAPLLSVDDLTISYEVGGSQLTAVSNASLELQRGENFGLVGESGCGKSTLARAIIGALDDNGEIVEGEIHFDGQQLTGDDFERQSDLGWDKIAFIPQSSMNTLDPIEKIEEQAIQIASNHGYNNKEEIRSRLKELFGKFGLPPDRIENYPHELSGGMQQRVVIALAMLLEPELVIADEPTTALDVILQDQIFKYLEDFDESRTDLMIITHDISLVFENCQQIGIMHSGQICEVGPAIEVYHNSTHPYTNLLQRAFPDIRHPKKELATVGGVPPQNMGAIDYCTFADRCPIAVDECEQRRPLLDQADHTSQGHTVACHRKDEARELVLDSDAGR